MHCNVWCDKNLCGTNLCDQRLTHIIHINKTRAEKCRFMVLVLLACKNIITLGIILQQPQKLHNNKACFTLVLVQGEYTDCVILL